MSSEGVRGLHPLNKQNLICPILVTLLALPPLTSCKPTQVESTTHADGTPVDTANAAVTPNLDGSLRLSTESASDKAITGVTNVEAVGAMRTGTSPTLDAPIEAGTLTITKATFQVNSVSDCTKDFSASGPATCVSPNVAPPSAPPPNPTPTFDPGQAAAAPTPGPVPTPTANDIKQEIVLHPGIVCGSWYGKQVWQKAFDVRLTGKAQHLDQVASVNYSVFAAYPESGRHTNTDRAKAFALGKRFLTPATGWSIGIATAKLKDGAELTLAKAQLDWDRGEDPTRPAGEPCTP